MIERLRLAAVLAVMATGGVSGSAGASPFLTGKPGLDAALAGIGGLPTLAEAQAAAAGLKDSLGLVSALPAAPQRAPIPAFPATGTAVVEMVDMRLLLAQIAVQTGARDHLALARAQDPGAQQVILLRGGHVTLPGLLALIAKTPAAAFVSRTPEGVTLTRAIVLWPDAGLKLGAKDTLILSRADGAFLANFGRLDIQGAALRGTEAANTGEPAFRPFLLTAGRGSLTVSGARFAHLGFGDTQRFGGVAVDTSGLQPPLLASSVTASAFSDVATLALINTADARASGNWLSGGAILIAHAARTEVAGNLVSGAAEQAIRVSNGSTDARITDNILLGAQGGIAVDQASLRITLTGNVLSGQTSTGIRLDKVDCVRVSGNLMALGQGAGLSISKTGRVAVAGNVIVDNGGSGILLRDQQAKASVQITGNTIAGNHEGLRGATAGALTLSGNDMEGQLPRLFAGDLAPRTIAWLEDRRSRGAPQALLTDLSPVCPAEGSI